MDTKLTFSQAWKFPSVVARDIKGYSYCETKKTDRKFNSGRDVYSTTFYNASGTELETRTAMKLTAKSTGTPYCVCETNEAIAVRARPRQSAELSAIFASQRAAVHLHN
jgi:hypothetical protein